MLKSYRCPSSLLAGGSSRVIVQAKHSRACLRPWITGHDETYSTLRTSDHKLGYLAPDSNKALFYFDSVYHLQFSWLSRLPWPIRKQFPQLLERIDNPASAKTNPVNIIKNAESAAVVNEVIPRLTEGGAFVRLSLPEDTKAEDVEESLKNYLRKSHIKPWWNPFQRMRVGLVHGKPWIEDLYRFPSARLKVEYLSGDSTGQVAELTKEQLYTLFRPYGKIMDIVLQPNESKVLPRHAIVDFNSVRLAAMAKNCLHGIRTAEGSSSEKMGTVLHITFERKIQAKWVRDWIFNHPRIVIPIVAALIAGLTVAVFDPIRTFFIKHHIKRTWSVSNNKLWTWLRSQATDIINLAQRHHQDSSLAVIWDDRRENINQIKTWLLESAETFIIVQGPRGSGKRELVLGESLENHGYKLVIDCKPLQEARGDSSMIRETARQVGYKPVFSLMNTISGWIDLAAQGTTGVKTGFSETLDTQIQKIFNSTAAALKQIILEERSKDDKDAGLSDDEYLAAHPEKRVVVVVDNFLHKIQDGSMIYDKIAALAANLVTGNVAHVIFLTHDVSFSKSLTKALPDRMFRQILLRDSSPEAAKRFIVSKLDAGGVEGQKLVPSSQAKDVVEELDGCIETVGGRLGDLEYLVRRIKIGETPQKAVKEIVSLSASEILKMYLYNQDENAEGKKRWTQTQAWTIIKQFASAANASLRYNEIILDDVFKTSHTGSPEHTLQALESAEMINIVVAENGRPQSIKPGKPVYYAAFQQLAEDRVLSSHFEMLILGDLIKAENSSVGSCESELNLLGQLPSQPHEINSRVKWLLRKIAASQVKIERWESEQSALKNILKAEY